MTRAYYSEFDPTAAAWLRELIAAGEITEGTVDERDIRDVAADDLRRHRRVHLFAGISGWELALRLAGWPADLGVFTGSCPCQPFSSAGKRKGNADARHLWPEMFRLVRGVRPPVVFGEQVASAIGHGWFDGIRGDLEREGYAVWGAVLGAFSAGAPHIRQRLFWVADAGRLGDAGRDTGRCVADGAGRGVEAQHRGQANVDDQRCSSVGVVADAHSCECGRCQGRDVGACEDAPELEVRVPDASGRRGHGRAADPDGRLARHRGIQPGGEHGQQPADCGVGGGMGDAVSPSVRRHARDAPCPQGCGAGGGEVDGAGRLDAVRTSPLGDHWSDAALIPCRDGKHRRVPRGVEPGVLALASRLSACVAGGGLEGRDYHPLAAGKVEGRVGVLRGAGNAIVPATAALFIRAWMRARGLT